MSFVHKYFDDLLASDAGWIRNHLGDPFPVGSSLAAQKCIELGRAVQGAEREFVAQRILAGRNGDPFCWSIRDLDLVTHMQGVLDKDVAFLTTRLRREDWPHKDTLGLYCGLGAPLGQSCELAAWYFDLRCFAASCLGRPLFSRSRPGYERSVLSEEAHNALWWNLAIQPEAK